MRVLEMKKRIKPPFKYYGGKFYLCKWIASYFPPHKIYVEPFGGAASVLLNKEKSEIEVYNDLNFDIALLMKYIRDDLEFLTPKLLEIPCEEKVYYKWKSKECTDPLDKAIRAFVVYRMSRGGTATTFSKSCREYRGLPENVAAWETSINNLPDVSKRLQSVQIESRDALSLIQQMDSPDTLFYLDPPYVSSSRKNNSVYQIEMEDDAHVRLLEECLQCKGKIVISGYESDLYDQRLKDWSRYDKTTFLHGGHSKTKRLVDEIVWTNFDQQMDST